MACPFCKIPLAGAEPYCPSCEIALDWSGDGPQARIPDIRPGAVLFASSFARDPLPGRASREEVRPGVFAMHGAPDGVRVTYERDSTGAFTDFSRAYADACVRATFTPLDAGARLGLSARHAVIGGAQVCCVFTVNLNQEATPGAWFSRDVQWSPDATSEPFGRRVALPDGVQPGRPVELELRVRGPSLRAYVNGVGLLAAHDPTFCQGAFGIRAGRDLGVAHAVRVLCHGYEIRDVSA